MRDLGLPREALVTVIVRGERAIPPRGSTVISAGDRLHVLVASEAADVVPALIERWRAGPIGPRGAAQAAAGGWHARVHGRALGRRATGTRPGPASVGDLAVIDRLRTRRDVPGSLVLLEDGRYAVTGPTLALGSRQAVGDWVRRRVRSGVPESERVWWEEVLGALALEAAAP